MPPTGKAREAAVGAEGERSLANSSAAVFTVFSISATKAARKPSRSRSGVEGLRMAMMGGRTALL